MAVLPLRAGAAPAEEFTVLEAREGMAKLGGAGETAIWGYDGKLPGPVLRVKRSEEVKVRLFNKLDQPTTISWHGVRIANAMDGVGGLTQKPVEPGESFDYRFKAPDSGLFWFHPHVTPQSAEQIGRGLYGVLIVEEADPPKVDDDILLVIGDWALNSKGQIEAGKPATQVTINGGATAPAKTVAPGSRLRLRLLNASGARIAIVGFEGLPATVIAIDGQPSEIFRPARATIPIGPGSRFEVMVDLPPEAGKAARVILRGETGADVPLLTLKTEGKARTPKPAVAKLPDNPLLPTRIPLEASVKRDLVIESVAPKRKGERGQKLWSLGGSDGFAGKPFFSVKRGGAVTIGFVNKTSAPQQMHVHGHVFRILHDLDDGWDPYWRESVLVPPGKTKHVAFIADNPGKWAIESLTLDRQVSGLSGWFAVT